MKLTPYLHFQGKCEEAFNTYKSILGGSFEIVSRYDEPAMKAPEEFKNQVLHAWYKFDDNMILASDTFPGTTVTAGSNTLLSLAVEEEGQARKIFSQLAEGGTIMMPFERQFWGDLFGQLTDRFGIRWMLFCEQKAV